MLLLLNSSVMLADGYYTCKTITAQEAKELFLRYSNDYKSFLGYPNSCRVFSELTSVKVPLCRDITELKDGDVILAMRLKYRVPTDEKSSRKHGERLDDYTFHYITYSSVFRGE